MTKKTDMVARYTCPGCGRDVRHCPFCDELVHLSDYPRHLSLCDDAKDGVKTVHDVDGDDAARGRRETTDADDGGLTPT